MSATVVVQFGQGADSTALVKVELDGVVNLDAEGNEKTSFIPGDQPVFLVHHDSSLVIGSVACSSGLIQPLGAVSRDRTQRMEWPELTAQELEYNTNADLATEWFGNDAGVTLVGRTLTPAGAIPAVCDVSLSATFQQFRLIPPPITLAAEEDYPILIVVTMEAA
jgi:hypothetical protein